MTLIQSLLIYNPRFFFWFIRIAEMINVVQFNAYTPTINYHLFIIIYNNCNHLSPFFNHSFIPVIRCTQ
jgi:hypothetical protein